MQISLIIPMYNESTIIEKTAQALSEYMKGRFDSYEILFCDDGSSDGSAELVRKMNLPNTRVIGYAENKGKGSAVRYAMLQAQGELLMFTDADLAYGTNVIEKAYRHYHELPKEKSEDYMLIGSRNLDKNGYEGYTLLRKIMSRMYIRVLCLVGGFRLTDSQCGCKAFSKKTAKEIFSRCKADGFSFDFEMILWAEKLNIPIYEMPVTIIHHHESKVRYVRDSFKMLRDLKRIRKNVKKTPVNPS